jgi:hypothetical protein
MYKEGTRLSRAQIPPVIIDSNQACMAKMIGRRGSYFSEKGDEDFIYESGMAR